MRLVWFLSWLACGGQHASTATSSSVAPAAATTSPEATEVASQGAEADLARVLAFHETRPVYERALGVGADVPAGVGSLSAEACGTCHVEIYEEWKVSTHAMAWKDPQFQAEIQKSDNRWLCLNCHTPLLVQQDRWPVGLVDGDVEAPQWVSNAGFDEALREQGITCAACHVRDGVIEGPGLPDSAAPHPVRVAERLQSEAVCLRCHQAVATYPGKDFVCTFNTGKEWEASPAAAAGQSCAHCHMPEVERPAALGGPVRKVRQHWWRGAGIPKFAGIQPPLEANGPGLGLEARWRDGQLALTVSNARAGHMLPSGDPERWVQVDVRFEDGEAGVGSPWSHRIGQVWRWWPEPAKVSDNRLKPQETRTWDIPVPPRATRAIVEASSHRMSEETAAHHQLEDYPRSIQTHRLELDVPAPR